MTTANPATPNDGSAIVPASASFDEVYLKVVELLRSIVGEDYFSAIDVTPDSSFETDLELESMEIVQLSEELIAVYGSDVDFIGWFGSLELEELIGLRIRQLVDFIVSSVAAEAA